MDKYILILALILSASLSSAGTLDSLEESATKKRSSSSSSTSMNSSSEASNDIAGQLVEGLLEIMIEAIGGVIAYGGESSLKRFECTSGDDECAWRTNASGDKYPDFYREPGDPTLPMFKLSANYLSANKGVEGWNGYVEAGYGAFAISHEHNSLYEKSDSLFISNVLLHYRMSFSNSFSLGFALGRGYLRGNGRHSGTAFGVPIRIRFGEDNYSFEYYPVSYGLDGFKLSSSQFTLSRHMEEFAVNVGWKSYSTDEVSIEGPFAGIQFTY